MKMFKPIGFYLSKEEPKDHYKIYSSSIKSNDYKWGNIYLRIWYIGKEQKTYNKNKFVFSFPVTDNLLDRNIVIKYNNEIITIENDWLGSIPIYYNINDLIISTNPNLCIKNKSIDVEGLQNYVEYGYSVFEHTSFRDVKILRYYSKITIYKKKLQISYKIDPLQKAGLFSTMSSTEEVVSKIKDYINFTEKLTEGDIIIPTSGGYDSRLINWAVKEKERVWAFTYGIASNQSDSIEVVYARKLSELLNIKWSQIELFNFNNYIDEWHRLYGFATHLHGMYQMEFYDKILKKYNDKIINISLISGIIGDLWAGNVNKLKIKSLSDIKKLGYSHGLKLSKKYFKVSNKNKYAKSFFDDNKIFLNDDRLQIVLTIRMKIILLSYLISVPEYYGILTWTPFLNFDIAVSMLRLPAKCRKSRAWQRKFFNQKKLDIENMNLHKSTVNKLDHLGALNTHFEPIKADVFQNLLNNKKINKLNIKVNSQNKLLEYVLTDMKVRSILRKLGCTNVGYLKHLNDYYIIKALEKSMLKW